MSGTGSASSPGSGDPDGPGGSDGPGSGSGSGDPGRDGAGVGRAGRAGRAGRRTVREDLQAARHDLRRAQLALRHSVRQARGRDDWARSGGDGADGEDQRPSYWWPPSPGGPPRWDNWGRHHHGHAGVRPGTRARSARPGQPPPPGLGGAGDGRPPAPAPAPPPPLRHRHDGSTLLGLLAVVFGLAWLAAGTRLAHVSSEAVVAVALMVLGAVMVVTARTDWALSRRAWPTLGGAGLALALLALSVSPNLPVGFRHLQFGSRNIVPMTWADVPANIHGGFGRTVIDLTNLPAPPPSATTISVDNAAGHLEIDIPAGLPAVLDGQVSAGLIDVDGVAISGMGRVVHEVIHPASPGPPLTLHVQVGFGSVAITTALASGGLTPTRKGPLPTPPTLPKIPLPGGAG